MHDKLSGSEFYERFDEVFEPEIILLMGLNELKKLSTELRNLAENEDERVTNANSQQAGIDVEEVSDVIAIKRGTQPLISECETH